MKMDARLYCSTLLSYLMAVFICIRKMQDNVIASPQMYGVQERGMECYLMDLCVHAYDIRHA